MRKKNEVWLRFIGRNGSMGLHTDSLYVVTVDIKNNMIWVNWANGSCPYSSFEKFMENWEVTKYK